MLFEGLDNLGKPASVKGLDDQRALGTQVRQREIQRKLAHLLHAHRIRTADAREVGCHVRHHQVDQPAIQGLLELPEHLLVAEIALNEPDASDRLHRKQIERNDTPVDHPAGADQPLARDLGPTSRCSTEIHDDVSATKQFFDIKDLRQFEGRTGAIALLLRQLDVRVIDVLHDPFFGKFLFSHSRTMFPMTILDLTPRERNALRAAAHPLKPVVLIGDNGLTTAVLKEIDVHLAAHELIKVRASGADRDARDAMLAEICEALSCAPVHHLGKTLIIYRAGTSRSYLQPPAEPLQPSRRRPSEPHTPKKLAAEGKKAVRTPRRARPEPQADDGARAPRVYSQDKSARAPSRAASKTSRNRDDAHNVPRRSALSLRAGARRNTPGATIRKRSTDKR